MYKKILVATDGSEASSVAVDEAVRLAALNKCPLIATLAVPVTDEFEAVASDLEDRLVEHGKKVLEQIEAQAAKKHVKAEIEVHAGEPYRVIIETAEKHHVDLIVMGRYGKTALTRLLMGSVTSRVIGHARCHVLVVNPG